MSRLNSFCFDVGDKGDKGVVEESFLNLVLELRGPSVGNLLTGDKGSADSFFLCCFTSLNLIDDVCLVGGVELVEFLSSWFLLYGGLDGALPVEQKNKTQRKH